MLRIAIPTDIFGLLTVDVTLCNMSGLLMMITLVVGPLLSLIGAAMADLYARRYGLKIPINERMKHFWMDPFDY